jgi:Domain of unknown function (DUF4832)
MIAMPDKKRADPSRRSFLTKVSAGLLGSSARLGRCLSAASCFSAGASLLAQALNTIRPLELDVPLSNPYMGWGIWAGPQQYGYSEAQFTATDNTAGFGDDTSLFSWVMIDWPWHKLEPKESHYDWSEFDKVTKFWAAHGKQLVVRLWVTDDAGWNKHPGGAVIPEWVWKKGVGYREYKGESDVVQREPDYLAPSFEGIYLPALRGLLNSFAANYDKANSPFIFMQIMGYGQWADWATWYSHYPWPSDAIKHEHLSKIVALFTSTFKTIPLLIPYMGDWDNQTVKTLDDHLYRMAINEALKADTGLIFTGFIEGLSAQPWTEPTTERFWRQRALVGEGWSYQEIKKDGTHGTLDENLDGALEYHTNLFHYYVDSGVYPAAIRDDKAHFERGLKRGGLGYRLVLAEASWPQRLRAGQLLVIQQKWRNRNVGRLYVRHYLRLFLLSAKGDEKFSFTDNNFDPTPYVDGQEYSHLTECHLPDNWPPGTYELRIALVDRENQPVIRLAIAGEDAKLRYSLGTVQILSPTSEIALV